MFGEKKLIHNATIAYRLKIIRNYDREQKNILLLQYFHCKQLVPICGWVQIKFPFDLKTAANEVRSYFKIKK